MGPSRFVGGGPSREQAAPEARPWFDAELVQRVLALSSPGGVAGRLARSMALPQPGISQMNIPRNASGPMSP